MIYAIGAFISVLMWENIVTLNILMFAMILDTILWALKWIRFWRFSSHSLFWGVITKILALSIVLLLQYALTAKNLFLSADILSATLGLLIVAEFISILQNYQMVRTGKQIEERDALSYLFNFILWRLREYLESFKFWPPQEKNLKHKKR